MPDSEVHRDSPDFAADEVLTRIQHDFRWPKPNDEAIASALRSIQKVAIHATGEAYGNGTHTAAGVGCPKCGELNSPSNRFCGYCGKPLHNNGGRPVSSPKGGQHVHHHHYHHHFFENGATSQSADTEAGNARAMTSTLCAESLEQDAADVQKLVRDWGLLCNSRRTDELAALYSSEAIVLRPDMAPARGLAAIRQMLKAALDAGLGEVELDGSDTGILGPIACLTGRSRMLGSGNAGKRQEQTGKYLIVARREAGKWRILADSWSLDSMLEAPAAETAPITTKTQRKVS